MKSSNKVINLKICTGRCISVIVAIILLLKTSAMAQNISREIISQRVNDVLHSVCDLSKPQAAKKGEPVVNSRHSKTKEGYLRNLGVPPGHYIPVSSVVQGNAEATAKNFLTEHKDAFGTRSRGLDHVKRKMKAEGSRSHVRFQQTYGGLPIFGAETVVQLNVSYGVEYVLSDVMRNTELLDSGEIPIIPTIFSDEAYQAAIRMVKEENSGFEYEANEPNLMIYEPSVVGNTGTTQLVWRIIVTSVPDPIVEGLVLVNAHSGEIVLHYSLVKNAQYREVYDADNTSANPGILCREEGDPSSGQFNCDHAYDYLGDTYDFYYFYHGRDSIDNDGMVMSATIRYCNPGETCPWPYAAWGSESKRMYFGENYVTDDITAHELTHGVTDYESGLIYLNESGAISESFSDMWGEWIDQGNGRGDDRLSVKWLIGEDLGTGAIRDMENPPVYGDPDRMGSPLWYTGTGDNGGVHINCGVNNKLCYLLTDGGTFNGQTVTGMGFAKIADLYYEVQTNLLSSGADYTDLYSALTQAAINLGWTSTEKQNLEQASQAVGFSEDSSECLVIDFETGDFSVLPWIGSGDEDWTITSSDRNTGNYSAKAGTIGNGQSTSLEVTLDCDVGGIHFYRKVSSESGYDYLKFYIDGILTDSWSGTKNWVQVSYPVSAGSRTFKWTYSKDGSSSSGSDTAWIDDIKFPASCGIAGDFNGDGTVDLVDYSVLSDQWGQSGSLISDIAPEPIDGEVGILDLMEFVSWWLEDAVE